MTAPRGAGDAAPLCEWCGERPALLPGRFCHVRCRQAAHRARRRRTTPPQVNPAPGRFCYLDPPYMGLAKRYYRDEPSYAGEVDHRHLIARAMTGGFLGWALSASERSLRHLLPLCPEGARLCPWVKPIGVPSTTYGMHSTWEALIVVGGRRLRPGKRDWLRAQPARFGGDLMGRKPLTFCTWLFDCLGMLPGDELEDWFPGTGIVSRAWAEVGRASSAPRGGDVVGDAEELLLATASPGSAEAFGDVVQVLGDAGLPVRINRASPGPGDALSSLARRADHVRGLEVAVDDPASLAPRGRA